MIKIVHGALHEHNDDVVLRGSISQESLVKIQVDAYQRKSLTPSNRRKIRLGVLSGARLPDIELSCRGGRYKSEKTKTDGEVFSLSDEVFVVDGLQRLTTMLEHPEATMPLGAIVHFNKTSDWERARFRTLNADRNRVHPNILLRNMKEDSDIIATLYNLSLSDRSFILNGAIGWEQNLSRKELIGGTTYLKTIAILQSHMKSGLRVSNVDDLRDGLDKLGECVGMQTVRANTKAFFDLIDECWNLRRVHFRDQSPYIKYGFLRTLAAVLSDHTNFWQKNDTRLFVEADLRRKLAKFPMSPEVAALVAGNTSSGKGSKGRQSLLYGMVVRHLNSGKRTKHLTPRVVCEAVEDVVLSEDSVADTDAVEMEQEEATAK